MSKRYINDSFWTDSYVEKLTPDEKLLFIYLLTNPLNNIAGMYEIRSKRIGFETGYDIEVVENILTRFERDKKILRNGDFIVIVNHIKNQALNPSVIQGCIRIIDSLSDSNRQSVTGWVQSGLLYLTLLNLTLPNLKQTHEGLDVEETSTTSFKFTNDDMRLALMFSEKVETNFPMFKEKKDLNKWADIIRLMREQDNLNLEQIEFLICWVQGGNFKGKKFIEHSFWSANARSPKGLRKNQGQILAQIQNKYKVDQGILKENGKQVPKVVM